MMKLIYNHRLLLAGIIALMFLHVTPAAGATPQEILSKVVATIKKSGGMTASFKVSRNIENTTGSIKTSGNKFYLSAGGASTWFDGTTMWTANPSTKEITIVTPTSQEVAEANPLSYLNVSANDFVIAFSKRKEKGLHLIVLNPKKNGTGVKAIEIGVDSGSYLPKHIVVRDSQDVRTRVDISSVSLNYNPKTSDFTCPVSSMKGYEPVDLR